MKIIALRILTRKLLTSHWMAYYWLMLLYSHYNNSVQLSCLVMSDSLWPQQHARPPCPSPTPEVHPNTCPLSPHVIQPSHPLSSPSPPALNLSQHRGFSNKSALRIRWPKYWSFSFNISPSNEHPGLISFRMDWLDFLEVQATLKFSPTP